MEKVQEQEQTAEVFENDIDLYLHEFCDNQGIEDLKKESQNVWNGCLLYIYKYVFKNTDKLKISNNIMSNSIISSNCNAYDIDKVNAVCDYYIYICSIYDKEISIIGFSKLTGISQDCLYEWKRDERKLSSAGCEIVKKLSMEREESLSNKLVTGRQNPVGVLGVLNRHYAWNMPGVGQKQEKKNILSMDELPKLSLNNDLPLNSETGISGSVSEKADEI